MVAIQQTISNDVFEEIDTHMRFSFRFRNSRNSEGGQPESPRGAIQLGPPNRPTHPPRPNPTNPVKRALKDGFSRLCHLANSEDDSSSAGQNQYGPPNKPVVPPNPPRPPKKLNESMD